MTLIILLAGILLLLLAITLLKLNAFIALIIAAVFIGLCNQMPLPMVVSAIYKGVGDTLGSLLLVLGFGVLLGGILTDTGATRKICQGLIGFFGAAKAKYALVFTGFAVGLALFYNAGFIVLLPLVFTIAHETKLPLPYLALAMAAPLSVTHGFLPPHPGPAAIAVLFHADMGKTLLYGLGIAIPVLLVAGIIFPEFVRKIRSSPPAGMFEVNDAPQNLPGFGISLFTALIPVILMALATILPVWLPHIDADFLALLQFLGEPGMALLIAVLCALIFLGVARGIRIATLMNGSAQSVQAIALILLIIGAGGGLKEVLIQSHTAQAINTFFMGSELSPLVLGWLVATFIRIAIGSATVAGLTAAGIVEPFMRSMQVSPELMVLSIGAGSLMCSHVNDTGFWMFKEYLGLSLSDTFKTWTVMESLIGLLGLAGVLLLNMFL